LDGRRQVLSKGKITEAREKTARGGDQSPEAQRVGRGTEGEGLGWKHESNGKEVNGKTGSGKRVGLVLRSEPHCRLKTGKKGTRETCPRKVTTRKLGEGKEVSILKR